jgi:hypothetical protein
MNKKAQKKVKIAVVVDPDTGRYRLLVDDEQLAESHFSREAAETAAEAAFHLSTYFGFDPFYADRP